MNAVALKFRLPLELIFVVLCTAAIIPERQRSGNINDFVEYWASARQVLAGRDPYAAGPVLGWERQAGFVHSHALIMPNPPWMIPVIGPLGLLSFNRAQQLWFGLGLIATIISVRWLWELYAPGTESRWIPALAVGSFSPVAVALAMGQVSPLILLGVAGFIHFAKQNKLALSGAYLFLGALKPHLLFLFWVALLLWSIRNRTVKMLAAFSAVTATASLVAIWLDHSIFNQYFSLLRNGGILAELTPTVGGFLRLWLGRYYPLQVLPTLLALVWFFFHWRKWGNRWQWQQEMPMLLLVSLLTVSYSWFFDQVLLLPCLLQGAGWAMTSRRAVSIGVAVVYLATNASVVALILGHRTGFWYAWTVPAWFVMYALVRIMRRTSFVAENQPATEQLP